MFKLWNTTKKEQKEEKQIPPISSSDYPILNQTQNTFTKIDDPNTITGFAAKLEDGSNYAVIIDTNEYGYHNSFIYGLYGNEDPVPLHCISMQPDWSLLIEYHSPEGTIDFLRTKSVEIINSELLCMKTKSGSYYILDEIQKKIYGDHLPAEGILIYGYGGVDDLARKNSKEINACVQDNLHLRVYLENGKMLTTSTIIKSNTKDGNFHIFLQDGIFPDANRKMTEIKTRETVRKTIQEMSGGDYGRNERQ